MSEQMQQQQQQQHQQQRKVQEPKIFMPTEKDITPKLLKLFGDIDALINHYVIDSGEHHLQTTQRFVGWHVCQDFYKTFCNSFSPPGESRLTAWNVFQKEENERYCAEQEAKNQKKKEYKDLQGYFSGLYEKVKVDNPRYYEYLQEEAKRINAITPKTLNITDRAALYKRHILQLDQSLKFMRSNYNMHYMLFCCHYTSKTKMFPKRFIASEGGGLQAYMELEAELAGGSVLDCLNNNVYEAIGRQAGENAERLAAAAREKDTSSEMAAPSLDATSSEMAAPSLDVIPSERAAEDTITDEHAFGGGNDDDDADYIPVDLEGEGDSAHEGQDGLNDEAVDDSSVAIPRLVRAATAIQPSEMPFPSLPATPAPFEPSPVAVTVDVQLSQQRHSKPKLTKLKADLQLALITKYNKAAPPEDQRKNFPWRLFAQPDPKYCFKGWKWEGPIPKSFAEIKVDIMEEFLQMLNDKKIRIKAVGKKKRKTTEEADGQEKRIRR